MAARATRGSTAKSSITANSDKENTAAIEPKPKTQGSNRVTSGKAAKAPSVDVKNGSKRKREPPTKVEDEFEELPHNLGKIPKDKAEAAKSEDNVPTIKSATSGGTREVPGEQQDEVEQKKPGAGGSKVGDTQTEENLKAESSPSKKRKTAKAERDNKYGIKEGVSPFPEYGRPTAEECHEVAKVLRGHHPDCKPRPLTIPAPSQVVAGCGEVPSILDAMIRTLLSAATTGRNSSSAYQGMVARYGNRETGVGKGSVDYNAVRLASQPELEKAIASGGLARAKSKNIKVILDMVYEENQKRRAEFVAARESKNDEAQPQGAQSMTEEQKDAEITLADEDVLSLDHYYYLPTYEALKTFVRYPGIGVKTAACVALFCMQRPCFAVDTHVFRLCRWLGWLPLEDKKVSRDTAFSHLEVRIPDELKYDLHQLFIRHGKTCPRCRAATGESSASWSKGCPIDSFVTRTGPRKEGGSPVKKKAAGSKKAAANPAKAKKNKSKRDSEEEEEEQEEQEEEGEDEDEDLDMPDLGDDAPEDAFPDPTDDEEYTAPLKATKKRANPKNKPSASSSKAKPAPKAKVSSSSKLPAITKENKKPGPASRKLSSRKKSK